MRTHKPGSPLLLCPARALMPLRPFLNPSLTALNPLYFPKFTNPDPSHNPEIPNS
jgi:hypothetical protein